jgi:hypothetical protein
MRFSDPWPGAAFNAGSDEGSYDILLLLIYHESCSYPTPCTQEEKLRRSSKGCRYGNIGITGIFARRALSGREQFVLVCVVAEPHLRFIRATRPTMFPA